jgi:hypothetical protein
MLSLGPPIAPSEHAILPVHWMIGGYSLNEFDMLFVVVDQTSPDRIPHLLATFAEPVVKSISLEPEIRNLQYGFIHDSAMLFHNRYIIMITNDYYLDHRMDAEILNHDPNSPRRFRFHRFAAACTEGFSDAAAPKQRIKPFFHHACNLG